MKMILREKQVMVHLEGHFHLSELVDHLSDHQALDRRDLMDHLHLVDLEDLEDHKMDHLLVDLQVLAVQGLMGHLEAEVAVAEEDGGAGVGQMDPSEVGLTWDSEEGVGQGEEEEGLEDHQV